MFIIQIVHASQAELYSIMEHIASQQMSTFTYKYAECRFILKPLLYINYQLTLTHCLEIFHLLLQSISKEALYGSLDPNTREWTDGLFTHTLRKIIDNVRGESGKRQWIIFDGDVDPLWVENLNSVLDDSKLLTLPNGERLAIPSNVSMGLNRWNSQPKARKGFNVKII